MAQARVRLGFVSAAHLHTRGLLRSALECAEAEVVGLAEPDDELRELFAREFSGLTVFRTAEELYDKSHPKAIVTCADNRSAATVVADAAARGVHVMKEKPMAADLLLADRMATTAARGNIRLMVNWPPTGSRRCTMPRHWLTRAPSARFGRSTIAPAMRARRRIMPAAIR
jgi:predicted dehydrogenase